jgi:hypothetical protein
MNTILLAFIIIGLLVIDIIFFIFNQSLKSMRHKKNKDIFYDQGGSKRVFKTDESKEFERLKAEHVSLKEYEELLHKYNLLLDQNRRLTAKNNALESEFKRAK